MEQAGGKGGGGKGGAEGSGWGVDEGVGGWYSWNGTSPGPRPPPGRHGRRTKGRLVQDVRRFERLGGLLTRRTVTVEEEDLFGEEAQLC